MNYDLDTNEVIKLLTSTLKQCNTEYLSVVNLLNDDIEKNSLESLHVSKISLLGQMKAIREEIQKIEKMVGDCNE